MTSPDQHLDSALEQAEKPEASKRILDVAGVHDRIDEVLERAIPTSMRDGYLGRITEHKFDWGRAEAILKKPENGELLETVRGMKEPRVLSFDGRTLQVVEAAELSEADACMADEVDAKLAGMGTGARAMDRALYRDFAAHYPVDLGELPSENPRMIHGSWLSELQNGKRRFFGTRNSRGATANFDSDLPGAEKKHFVRPYVELN